MGVYTRLEVRIYCHDPIQKVSAKGGKQERLGVRFRSKARSKNRRGSKDRWGTDGTAASMYVLCHHIYTCPNLPGGQCLMKGLMREGRNTKSVGVHRSPSEVVG